MSSPASTWPAEVSRVAEFLVAAGGEARLEELAADCSSAEGAADAIGCTLGQIVKSLAFVCDEAGVVALVGGDRRADPAQVARAVGAAKARIAKREEVLELTGFAPGTVAPFALTRVRRVVLDRRLLGQPLLWVGAGSSRHMVAVGPAELVRLSRAEVAAISKPSA